MRIVVGSDGSAAGTSAVEVAAREAALWKARLDVIMAVRTRGDERDPSDAAALEHAAAAARDSCGPDAEVSVAIVHGEAGPALCEAAIGADLLVVGRRGRGGVTSLLLGSTSQYAVQHAPCPVLVAAGAAEVSGPVLVGVDGSPAGRAAALWAGREAALRAAPLEVRHAYSLPAGDEVAGMALSSPVIESIEGDAKRLVDDTVAAVSAEHPGVRISGLCQLDGGGRTLVEGSRSASLVVVGATGRSALARVLLGSVSRHVSLHAACPAVIVRSAGEAQSIEEPL